VRGDQPPRMAASPYEIQQCLRQAQCYPSSLEARLVNELSQVLQLHPSFRVNIDYYVSNAGVQQRLIYLGGTVPIVYRAVTYHIPVRIWIMTYHPRGPPVIFVRPNQTMQLTDKHEHVDSAGQVFLPELAAWDASLSTIPQVITRMEAVFSKTPPLFSRRTEPGPRPFAISSDAERLHLVRELTERTRRYLGKISEDGRAEYTALQLELEEIRKGEIALRDAEEQMRFVSKQTSEQVAALRVDQAKLRRQMEDNQVDKGDVPIERCIVTDPLTWQVVNCVSQDAAFQDSLETLSVAFGNGAVDFDKFMKDAKRLSRELYMVRALKLKIRRCQASMRGPDQLTTSAAAGAASQM
jgi:ESCRT-I complex subunit TSG101